jgi:hypothetical protein
MMPLSSNWYKDQIILNRIQLPPSLAVYFRGYTATGACCIRSKLNDAAAVFE